MGSSFKCNYLKWIDDIKMLTSAFAKRQMFAKNKHFYIWKWHFTPRFQVVNPWILENYINKANFRVTCHFFQVYITKLNQKRVLKAKNEIFT